MADFREAIATWLAGPLQGITLPAWWRLVRDPRHRFHPEYLPKVLWTGVGSLLNSLQARRERRLFGDRERNARVESPVFIMGPYRSGTTHLHNLMTVDSRFGFSNYYQVTFPQTFLTTEAMGSRMGAFFALRRRPYDDVALGLGVPAEDELALCSTTFLSYHMCWHFPAATEHYRRFVTFDDARPEDRERWKTAFERMARKLTVRYDRPLVFKSPCHTARIPMILETFPDARFVHIHRDPFEVFQSTRKMEKKVGPLFQFQRRDLRGLDDHILWRYRATYDAYLDHRALIPDGRLVEISYAELVRDPVGALRRVYGGLGLPDFEETRPAVEHYLAGLRDYKTNRYADLDETLTKRIAADWERFFDEWQYDSGGNVMAGTVS